MFVNEPNDTTNAARNQAATAVKQLIEKLSLPDSLNESAKAYGALVRHRVIKSAEDLLVALFIYAISGMSQRLLAACTTAMYLADMSDQAWQKKIVQCEPWLSSLLSEILFELPQSERKPFQCRPMKLIDGSMFVQAGNKGKKGGKSVRVHMCYNLTEGAMDSLVLTDEHTAESVEVLDINPGDIILADAGFGKGKNLAYVVSRGADALFRATPAHLRLDALATGKSKIDMAAMLSGTTKDVLDFDCYVHTENGKYHPVRVIASRLPEDKALLAKTRKQRTARKKQTQIKGETLIFAEWVILITSLGREFSANQLLEMYRARWQIELLFKRIKQSFKVQKLPPATLKHSTVLVLLRLILWALVETQALAAEMLLLKKGSDMERYSPWAMQSFLLFQVKASLDNLLASCPVNADNTANVFQRLLNHHSSRRNQYALFHFNSSC
jgi:hypothetical protein